jgi:hypothetical protein
MTTAGKTLVIASSGTAFGNYTRTRRLASVAVNEYREVAFPLSGSSALPNAVDATAAMTTAGNTLVLASAGASFGQYARICRLAVGMVSGAGLAMFLGPGAEAAPAALIDGAGLVRAALRLAPSGTAFGHYARTRRLAAVAANDYREVAFPLSGSSALPNAVYATAAMTTAGNTLVIASAGASFGQYARTNRLAVLLDRSIGQAAAETAPAGIVSGSGTVVAGLEWFIGTAAEGDPTALIDGAGFVRAALRLAPSGTAFGHYARTRRLAAVAANEYREVAFPLSGSSALPNAVYATAAMTTAGNTLVLASAGASFGQYARTNRLAVLLDRGIEQAAAETAPAGTASGSGLERFIGSGAEGDPTALIDGAGSVSGIFTGTAVETALAGLNSGAGLERFIGTTSVGAPVPLIDGAGLVSGAFHGSASEIAPTGLVDAAGHVGAGLGGSSGAGVTQVLIEVAAHGEQGAAPPSLVVTQDVIEWALHPANTLTVTQDVIEWALHPANNLRVTQSCIEVAYKGRRQPRVIARYQRALP